MSREPEQRANGDLLDEAAMRSREVARAKRDIEAEHRPTESFASTKYKLLMATARKQGHYALAAEFAARAFEALLVENELVTPRIRRQMKRLEKQRAELEGLARRGA